MKRRADGLLDEMRTRLLDGPGELDRSVRRAALEGNAVPPSVAALVEKIRHHAYKVTDADVQDALAAGWTENQLFELSVATAVGAGLHRREAVDRLLSQDPATA
jgi:hypothetical protein